VTGDGCTNKLHRLKNNKKINKNEEIESLMIGNIPELVEAARREVVVREVVETEFLATAPFAIHVAMQLVLKDNLTDKLLLGECLSIVVVLLSHCFILCPLEFDLLPLLLIPLPHSLLELFDLRLARERATPRTYALRRRRNLLSSHMPGVDYTIKHGIPATCIT
jgi:hypothetical protein